MRRKSLFILLAIFFLFVSYSNAGISVGFDFKGGLNLARLRGGGVDPYETNSIVANILPGAIVGMGIGLNIGDVLTIQPEVYYSQKGLRLENTVADDDYLKIKLSYLELILPSIKMRTSIGDAVPNFFVGPSLGICLTAVNDTINGGEQDIKKTTRRIDFGIAVGGGVDIEMKYGGPIISIVYTIGLLDTQDPKQKDSELINSVLSVMVGYGFDLGKK